MQKTIKLLLSFLLINGLIFNYSCIKNNEQEQRTFDDEMAELDAMLVKLNDSGYNIDTTEMGVYYVVKEPGEGPFPKTGDTCFIDFTGYLSNGVMFESSEEFYDNGIWKFVFGNPEIIPGLEDGIAHMNKGAKIEMIIPSNLAYGANGTANIPPYTTLLYTSKMHDLRPKDQ
ncbi:MAG: FKBP-type peptidyl-prolyl cis-trans isomerase [Bacteroidota bacterium]